MKRKLLLLFALTSCFVKAQTPGGVAAGANMKLWLSGDANVTNTSGSLTWGDRSGNGNDVVQTNPLSHPTQTTLLNYNETFTFDGIDDRFPITSFSYLKDQELSNLNMFVVYKTDATSGVETNKSFVGFDGQHGYSAYIRANNGRLILQSGPTISQASGSTNDDLTHIGSFVFDAAAAADTKIRVDGVQRFSGDKRVGNIIFTQPRSGYIGDEATSGSTPKAGVGYQGDIAEIILFDVSAITNIEIQKIESYLALKYGITLGGNYLNSAGTTIWDATANAAYHNNVAGLINDVPGAINQKVASSEGSALVVATTADFTSANSDSARGTSLAANTHVLFGDNGAADGFDISGFSLLGKQQLILKKKWLFKESASEPGNIFIGLPAGLLPGTSSSKMIVSRGNATFEATDMILDVTFSGGYAYTTTAFNIQDGDYVSFIMEDVKIAGVSILNFDLVIRADHATEAGGVLTLEDGSGNRNDAVQNVASKLPNTSSNLMNFNPTLKFDGTSDYLYLKNKFYTAGQEISNMHAFTVFKTDFAGTSTLENSSFLDFNSDKSYALYVTHDGKLRADFSNDVGAGVTGGGTTFYPSNDDIPHIGEYIFDAADSAGKKLRLRVDGRQDAKHDTGLSGNIKVKTTTFGMVGDGSQAITENGPNKAKYYQGDLSEILLADQRKFTDFEIQKIRSYLGLKYGVDLLDAAGDYLDSKGNTLFTNENTNPYRYGVAGLIKDDVDSDLDQRVAQSTTFNDLIIATTNDFLSSNLDGSRTSLNEGSFLVFGNNASATKGIVKYDELSGEYITTRKWFFKEGGTNLDDLVYIAIPKDYFEPTDVGIKIIRSRNLTFDSSDTIEKMTLNDAGTPADDTDDFYSLPAGMDIDDGDYIAFILTRRPKTPGSVESGLTMWLKANQDVSEATGIISSIADLSFSGNGAVQPISNKERPRLEEAVTNYNPTMAFNGKTEYLAVENLVYSGVGQIKKLYSWVIYKATANASASTNADDRNTGFLDFDRKKYFGTHLTRDGQLELAYRDNGNLPQFVRGTTQTNDDQTHLGGFIFDHTLPNKAVLRLDGAIEGNKNTGGSAIGTNVGTQPRVGYVGAGSRAPMFEPTTIGFIKPANHYDGDISEIIYYEGETLNPTQIKKVESYLAIKYGITLSNIGGGTNGDYLIDTKENARIAAEDSERASSTSTDASIKAAGDAAAAAAVDLVVWDASANAAYHNDIGVIGKDIASALNQKQSISANSNGVLTVSFDSSVAPTNELNTATNTDLQFLAWGSKNSPTTTFSIDCSSAAGFVTKEWKVQNTGGVGAVTLQFDITNIVSPSNLDLVLDTDGNFSTTGDQTVYPSGVLSANTLTYTGITLTDGTFFSIRRKPATIKYISYSGGSWTGGSGASGQPTLADKVSVVTINDDVTTTEDFDCGCLEVKPGATLIVPKDSYVSVNAGLILNGDIHLQGNSELIQTIGSNLFGTGKLFKIVDEATISPYQYNYLSSPVNTAGVFTLAGNLMFNTNPLDLTINTAPSFTRENDGFGTTISSRWTHIFKTGFTEFEEINETKAIEKGLGFTMKGTGLANKYNFIGRPNNGEIAVQLFNAASKGYVMIGNPYPSSINIDTFNRNMVIDRITDGSVYVWQDYVSTAHSPTAVDLQGGYATRAGGISTPTTTHSLSSVTWGLPLTDHIKPGQGFIVSGQSGGIIKFTNELRTGVPYNPTRKFYKTKKPNTERPVIRIGFEYKNENDYYFHRQIATVLEDGSTLGNDFGKDAYMYDYHNNDAYWIVQDEEGVPEDDRYVITSVPKQSEDLQLPIGVVVDDKRDVTLRLDRTEGLIGDVLLLDNVEGKITNIKTEDYKVTLDAGEYTDRFSLIFKGEEAFPDKEKEQVKTLIYATPSELSVVLEKGNIDKVQLYNIAGSKVLDYTVKDNTSSVVLSTANLTSQIYIVKVVTDTNVITKKIALVK